MEEGACYLSRSWHRREIVFMIGLKSGAWRDNWNIIKFAGRVENDASAKAITRVLGKTELEGGGTIRTDFDDHSEGAAA